MKTILLFLLLAHIGLFSSIAYGDQVINIMGQYVPIIEGARPAKEELNVSPGIRVAAYDVFKPLNDVISYYRDFLKGNNFLIIGGEERDGFNASARKEDCMFTIRIYIDVNKTILQFVW
ncbi:MAG: hypothetical protein V1842_00835 [Candidatus Omnitrophota bacterium]|nr:hypothetical protein [Candidatus Omnitrophota bacterium]MBU1929834.1 hypothetical protein [Candidatus Omnitrophota bacterium]MBU2035318.1 hypothetical protein [Candidatus Omnitrophota bacterium]MBU2257501.1 hypothetical protein [Candidatus Omnitrophota bacterium]